MFRHHGKRRTHIHNLRLASILSFVAGMVNIAGVLGLKTLTTNVTGHFAYFSEEVEREQYLVAFIFLLYILAFLLGAFISNFLVEHFGRLKPSIAHTFPIGLEIALLVGAGLFYECHLLGNGHHHFIACMLLMAMGIQNALVTKVSESVVRTTHLTGLFTDLGIELSQLFFYTKPAEKTKLNKSIRLRMSIILFFFSGCLLGGYLFKFLHLYTLLIAASCLVWAMLYDTVRLRFYVFKRRIR